MEFILNRLQLVIAMCSMSSATCTDFFYECCEKNCKKNCIVCNTFKVVSGSFTSEYFTGFCSVLLVHQSVNKKIVWVVSNNEEVCHSLPH